MQLMYFARGGGGAFLTLYLNIFYLGHGLTGAQIGSLHTIAAISVLLAAPNWGRISDRLSRPRRLLQGAMLVSVIAIFLLSQQTIYGWMALIVSINAMALAAVDPLADSMTMSLTRGEGYGSIRMWGSLGWAAFVFLAGWLINAIGLPVMFAGYIILVSIAALTLLVVPSTAGASQLIERFRPRASLREAVRLMFANRAMVWLFVALSLQQISFVSILIFEPVFLSDLGAGGNIGLGFAIAALIEAPAMLWVDRQLKMRGGAGLLRLGLLLGALRSLTVVLFPIIPVVIAGRVIEGFGYAFRQVSTVVIVTRNAPEGYNTTALALYTTTLTSIMQIIAAPMAGLVYDNLGAYWLYAFAIASYMTAILILWLVFPPERKPQATPPRPL
jgi:PPP family 3-phenylpropionic acid transporter